MSITPFSLDEKVSTDAVRQAAIAVGSLSDSGKIMMNT